MARQRKWKASTPVRFQGKMATLLAHRLGDTAPVVASLATSEYVGRIANYRQAYETAKLVLQENGVPKGLWGLYRSFVMKAVKEGSKGYPLDGIVEYFERQVGLDRGVMNEILDRLGLTTPPEATAPSKPAT